MNETLWYLLRLLILVLGIIIAALIINQSLKKELEEIKIQKEQNKATLNVISQVLEVLKEGKDDNN